MAEDHIDSPTEYRLMEEEASSSSEKIYILTSSSLPSHIRSVEVKHSGLISSLNTSACSTRVVNMILILIFVFVTSLTVSIAVYKITEITESGNELQSFHVVSDNSTSIESLPLMLTTEGENATDYDNQNSTEVPMGNPPIRKNCLHKCQLYADPKFKSDCILGNCVCRGENYQFLSCLPSVGDCQISKGFMTTANFSMASVSSQVYSCRPETPSHEGNQLDIVGVYGNHFAATTTAYISGRRRQPAILVLASYYPLNWKINLGDGIAINQILLVSQFSTDLSSIEVTRNDSSENDTSSPIIQTLQMPVGFGNDIHNSKTVDMLKVLTEKLGYVRSFTGAEFADDITLELPA